VKKKVAKKAVKKKATVSENIYIKIEVNKGCFVEKHDYWMEEYQYEHERAEVTGKATGNLNFQILTTEFCKFLKDRDSNSLNE